MDRTSLVNSISDNALSITGKNMSTIAKTGFQLIPLGSAEFGKSYLNLSFAFGCDVCFNKRGSARGLVEDHAPQHV